MELRIVTRPTDEPVSLPDAKAHLNVSHDDDDTFIVNALTAAREYCEHQITGCYQAMTAVYDGFLAEFPDDRIELPRPPHQGTTSVKYYDTDNTQQTLSSTAYQFQRVDDKPGYVVPVFGETWPSTYVRPDAVTVRFTAGSTAASVVPARFKHAVLLVLGHWYENREGIVTGTISKPIEIGVAALLRQCEYGHYE